MKDEVLTNLVIREMCPGAYENCAACRSCKYACCEECYKSMHEETGALLEDYLIKVSRHQSVEQVDLSVVITNHMHQLGCPNHLKGFSAAREAIAMLVEDPLLINSVTKELYPRVAKALDTTSSRVERAIRHCVEVAFDRADLDVLQSYFGSAISMTKGKPTNSEFLATLADKIRLEYGK